MSTQPTPRYTPEEYLAIERASECRHEFYRGEMFEMAGTSRAHSLIGVNLSRDRGGKRSGRGRGRVGVHDRFRAGPRRSLVCSLGNQKTAEPKWRKHPAPVPPQLDAGGKGNADQLLFPWRVPRPRLPNPSPVRSKGLPFISLNCFC